MQDPFLHAQFHGGTKHAANRRGISQNPGKGCGSCTNSKESRLRKQRQHLLRGKGSPQGCHGGEWTLRGWRPRES